MEDPYPRQTKKDTQGISTLLGRQADYQDVTEAVLNT